MKPTKQPSDKLPQKPLQPSPQAFEILAKMAAAKRERLQTAPTRADIEAQQDRAEQAAKSKAAADKAAEAKAAKERERADVKRLSESAARHV